MFLPDVSFRLFPAVISTFFPSILMFPFGALSVMPVKALIFTSPQGDEMLTLRPSVDPLMFQMPYLSPISTPPSKLRLTSLSGVNEKG